MSLVFDGEGYDITAEEFMAACKEIGSWEVVHPTKGWMALQLVDVAEADEPVRDTNRIVFETTWIDYIDPVRLKTPAQILADVGDLLNEFNADQLNRFQGVDTSKFSDRASVLSAADKIRKFTDKYLGPIADANAKISQSVLESQRAMQETIAAGILEPLSLAGQIKNTIELPMLAMRDTKRRLDACWNLAREIFAIETSEKGSKNVALTKELGLLSVMSAMSTVATSSEIGATDGINTQTDAVALMQSLSDFREEVNAILDAEQTKMNEYLVGEQYNSQGEAFTNASALIELTKQFILSNFFQLKQEKWIVLREPGNPFMLSLEYYGEPGENDSNYRLFLESNGLQGDETVMLPQGTQVVIYG
jgi:prophage DNA circulation protein